MSSSPSRIVTESSPPLHGGATPASTHPRLLFVGTYLAPPASRAISEDVAEHLARSGWSVRLTSRLPSRYARPLDILATILGARRSYDLVHLDVFSGVAFRWAEWAAHALRLLRKPFVLTLHGGNLPELARREPARVRRLLADAAAVTAPSEYLRAAMGELCPRMELLPNPLDLGSYEFRPRAALAPRLVWLRSFHAIYNPSLAVRVVSRLAPDFPSVRLGMIGRDKDGTIGVARSDVARLGLADHVAIVPGVPKSEVPTALQAGDVFLNTANIDNTPVSVLEAMACGLCVVSTDVGGVPYLLRHEHDALLVPPNDETAMATAVRRLLEDPALAERLSRNARATAERFGWAEVLPRWERLLHDVATRTGWRADG